MTSTGFGNEFWEKKFSHVFHMMDFNRDGILEAKDFDLAAESMIKVGKLDSVQAKRVYRKMRRIWEKFFLKYAKDGPVTEAVFIKSKKEAGRDAIMVGTTIMHLVFFEAIDFNGDGIIEEKELDILFKALELGGDAAEAFKHLDLDHDGKISSDDYVYAAVDYYCNGNEASPSKHLYGVWK